jgi:hypothetical protein
MKMPNETVTYGIAWLRHSMETGEAAFVERSQILPDMPLEELRAMAEAKTRPRGEAFGYQITRLFDGKTVAERIPPEA